MPNLRTLVQCLASLMVLQLIVWRPVCIGHCYIRTMYNMRVSNAMVSSVANDMQTYVSMWSAHRKIYLCSEERPPHWDENMNSSVLWEARLKLKERFHLLSFNKNIRSSSTMTKNYIYTL